MRRPEKLEIIRQVLKQVVPEAEVILYGSEARGDARPDSDFDLLILIPEDNVSPDRLEEITYPLLSLLWENGIDVSPMVRSKSFWDNHVPTPFYYNVLNEGIRL
ncbi:MAG: nucleotidyltransferase domain-containing protein [Bacteroidales bacterium]|nr:nucleotidyltransferase domain-containing protein [Bacteroidales bacterium]